jgi:hypothetical protein
VRLDDEAIELVPRPFPVLGHRRQQGLEQRGAPQLIPVADVMAVQAGYEPLDYSGWEQQKENYIAAIHAGLACDYRPMQTFVDLALV